MEVENLEKAEELREELRIINVKIRTVEKAKYVKMYGEGDRFETSTERMKYDSEILLQSIRPLFINSLNREKQDILNEIEALD
jgi:hypothetical protein